MLHILAREQADPTLPRDGTDLISPRSIGVDATCSWRSRRVKNKDGHLVRESCRWPNNFLTTNRTDRLAKDRRNSFYEFSCLRRQLLKCLQDLPVGHATSEIGPTVRLQLHLAKFFFLGF